MSHFNLYVSAAAVTGTGKLSNPKMKFGPRSSVSMNSTFIEITKRCAAFETFANTQKLFQFFVATCTVISISGTNFALGEWPGGILKTISFFSGWCKCEVRKSRTNFTWVFCVYGHNLVRRCVIMVIFDLSCFFEWALKAVFMLCQTFTTKLFEFS